MHKLEEPAHERALGRQALIRINRLDFDRRSFNVPLGLFRGVMS